MEAGHVEETVSGGKKLREKEKKMKEAKKERENSAKEGEERIYTIYMVIYIFGNCRFEQNRTRAAETLVSHKIYETN